METVISKKSGFTIVELLIVIVVIAILAAITIVSFRGIQERARVSSVTSGLSQISKKVALYQVENPDTYPPSLTPLGITSTGDVDYKYKQTSTGFCATATSGKISYTMTEVGIAAPGACLGHPNGGVALNANLVPNPSLETNTLSWNTSAGATITRVTDGIGIVSGMAALEINATTANQSGAGPFIAGLSPSTTYTFSAYITPISGDFTNLVLRVGDGNGTRAVATFNPALTTGQTIRRTVTWTSGATPGTTGISIFRSNTAPAASVVRIDAAMVELGSAATAYSE
jgi:prepilin-type N-terminal cleavage/methylation domain-containing protein